MFRIIIGLVGFFLAFYLNSDSQAQPLSWAKAIGGPLADQTSSIYVDSEGNSIYCGSFFGTVDFDPNSGVFLLSSPNENSFFISKLDSSGNFLWAKKFGSGYATSTMTDSLGNIFTTGNFSGTVDFDPSSANFSVTSAGGLDAFLLKLDSDGNFIWARKFGGTSADEGITVSYSKDNVYVSGHFQNTCTFNEGATSSVLNALGQKDAFILSCSSDGSFNWVKQLGGGGSSQVFVQSLAVTSISDIVITGYFDQTVDFDPGLPQNNLTSYGSWDIFLLKLDSSGVFSWVRQFGSLRNDNGQGVSVDQFDNVLLTGFFENSVDFDPSPQFAILTSGGLVGTVDAFIGKYTSSGNLIWVRSFGGNSDDVPYSITNDLRNNIYVSGLFYGDGDFDPGPSSLILNHQGQGDIFCSRFSGSGNLIWSFSVGSSGLDASRSVCSDLNGAILYSGYFSGTSDFNPGPQQFNLTNSGNTDIFVSKIRDCSIPKPSILFNGPLSFCNGDSLILSGPPGYKYHWSSLDSNLSIVVKNSGVYHLQIISNNCTSAISQPIQVLVKPIPPAPIIASDSLLSRCQGDSVVLSSNSLVSNLWSNGDTTQSVVVRSSGSFFVQVMKNGCLSDSSNNVSIIFHSPPQLGPILVSNDTLRVPAFPNTAYLWKLNNIPLTNADSSFVIALSNGVYKVIATSSQGCSDSSMVLYTSSLPVVFSLKAVAYPNPTSNGSVTILGKDLSLYNLSLYNTYGQIMAPNSWSINGSNFELKNLPSGYYFLSMKSSSEFYRILIFYNKS